MIKRHIIDDDDTSHDNDDDDDVCHQFSLNIQHTWRSGAEFGCARSQADSHGLILAKEPVLSSPTLSNLPPLMGVLC